MLPSTWSPSVPVGRSRRIGSLLHSPISVAPSSHSERAHLTDKLYLRRHVVHAGVRTTCLAVRTGQGGASSAYRASNTTIVLSRGYRLARQWVSASKARGITGTLPSKGCQLISKQGLSASPKEGVSSAKGAKEPQVRQERKSKRPPAMHATTTAQVQRIWSEYFASPADQQQQQQQEGAAGEQQQQAAGDQPRHYGAYGDATAAEEAASAPGGSGAAGSGGSGASAAGPAAAAAAHGSAARTVARPARVELKSWTLEERKATEGGRTLYGAAVCGDVRLTPGSVIRLGGSGGGSSTAKRGKEVSDSSGDEMEVDGDGSGAGAAEEGANAPTAAERLEEMTRGSFGMVQCIFTESASKGGSKEGSPQIQIRVMLHGRDTVLGDVAGPEELFLLDPTARPMVPSSSGGGKWSGSCSAASSAAAAGVPPAAARGLLRVVPLSGGSVAEVMEVRALTGRPCDHARRLENAKADLALHAANLVRAASGQPPVLVYRSVYCPLQGMFRELRSRELALGSYVEVPPPPPALSLLPGGGGFTKDGVTYRVGEFMYVRAGAVAGGEEEKESSSEEEEEEGVEEEEAAAGKKTKKAGAKAGAKGKAAAKKRGKSKAAAKVEEEEDDEEEEESEEEVEEEEESEEEEVKEVKKKERKESLRRQTHKGSNAGLRAWQVVQLLGLEAAGAAAGGRGSGGGQVPVKIQVRRFYRPEDISADLAYRSDYYDLYAPAAAAGAAAAAAGAAGTGALSIPVGEVYGKCRVMVGRPRPKNPVLDTFLVVGSYDPTDPRVTGPPPATLDPPATAAGQQPKQQQQEENKAEEGPLEEEEEVEEEGGAEALMLPTMDIFAGCGGLSEGMHQAGVADSKWAIEYDSEAAEAFRINNPAARVFCNNCNVLLQAAMLKAGLGSDCVAAPECQQAVAALDEATRADLPTPGSVGFLMGGPPCQGYSGMNRFNRGNWSQVQNSMVMAYLSYCDFYRPRYFLLENVRNFVAYNGGRVFRLVLRTLLDLGYQTRFGILNAGNQGLPQSRKRTFIWAAQPGELLPEWPAVRHIFMSSQLGVRMGPMDAKWAAAQAGAGGSSGSKGGASFYFASGPPVPGAPLRAVTVRDAIGDLPAVGNDAKEEVLPYTGEPVSAFQRDMRAAGGPDADEVVRDHIVKPMNELNLERCRCIPKGVPGADWRVLQQIVAADPSREFYKGDPDQPLVPWCLPNTAARHNGWRGLYGRLDPAGHFPTATTDPNPMGKVGQVLHPDQDRIVSVRECARSQGFPDHYRFYGNVHCRHRQVGNAVPPPLARALGLQLRRALKDKRARDTREAAEQLRGLRTRRQQQ
ncbi:hypothetical protein Agub_g7558 [Astrephomene gubernaculifera]|uniref:DNA (cytosine-5-)-methyltransferase n=1 Tax=Astrephomene gubernaculifera TaxID=47775 RepID=A0AAD3DQA5_9CHLO|nr:hypothetical protein Agub_g7558 [Astrephomene gubernaculifera]